MSILKGLDMVSILMGLDILLFKGAAKNIVSILKGLGMVLVSIHVGKGKG